MSPKKLSPNKLRSTAGLTMLEVVIASVILAAIVGMSSWMVWQSSTHVSTAESALQLEIQAREVLAGIVKELRQSKMTSIKKLLPSSIVVDPATAFNTLPAPGTLTPGSLDISSVPNPPLDTLFNAIRFRAPGPSMDLTKLNADNTTVKTNFDMQKFKANQDSVVMTYEIQYWWEIGLEEGKAGTGPNGLIPDGIDNNWNGIVDEGVIKKMESWYDNSGNLTKRTQSVVCRDVKYDSATGLGGLQFSIPSKDPSGVAYSAGAEKIIVVSLTLQKRDPRYPKDTKRLLEKTVSTTIEMRN